MSSPPRQTSFIVMDSSADTPITALPVAYEAPDERRFWTKLRRVIAHIPFAEDLVAGWYCAIDRDTPTRVRAVLFGAIAYFVLPADAIPDSSSASASATMPPCLPPRSPRSAATCSPGTGPRPAPASSASPTSFAWLPASFPAQCSAGSVRPRTAAT